jgi:hypothetical protein
MNMKRHMLIFKNISMLVDRKKEWGSYKMVVVIRIGWEYLLWKLIGKGSSYKERSYEVVMKWLDLKMI